MQSSAENVQMKPLELALRARKSGDTASAEAVLTDFIAHKFGLDVRHLEIRQDSLSLNSVNGTFDTSEGKLFFKFHLEEDEGTVEEYYRAELLAQAGYPVEQPLYKSSEVGEQILIYPYKASERLADMCRRLEKPEAENGAEFRALIAGQVALDRMCAAKTLETLHVSTDSDLEKEPLLQLFYWRLFDQLPDGGLQPGGRHYGFYVGQDFELPGGLSLPYDELAHLRWVVNGREYPATLDQGFEAARRVLAPDYFSSYAACTAHGDAHNGNVWANKDDVGAIDLSWFDPAFAGQNIPVLLAEVKTLFHNIFAHADWLYDSREADPQLEVRCVVRGGILHVEHNWDLNALRRAFLESKLENFWIPVLKELKVQDMLPDDWEAYVRAALFCCPTLVMNLRAGAGDQQNAHTPKTSALGLSIAMMLLCAPQEGSDEVSQFFEAIKEAI